MSKAQYMADIIDNDELDRLPLSRSEIAYMLRTQDTLLRQASETLDAGYSSALKDMADKIKRHLK